MAALFFGATSANPDVSAWSTGNVEDMSGMFVNATSATPDVSNWDTSPSRSNWDTSEVTNAQHGPVLWGNFSESRCEQLGHSQGHVYELHVRKHNGCQSRCEQLGHEQ